jgi:hypothetical protein
VSTERMVDDTLIRMGLFYRGPISGAVHNVLEEKLVPVGFAMPPE